MLHRSRAGRPDRQDGDRGARLCSRPRRLALWQTLGLSLSCGRVADSLLPPPLQVLNVDPIGGRLVLYDARAVPHEARHRQFAKRRPLSSRAQPRPLVGPGPSLTENPARPIVSAGDSHGPGEGLPHDLDPRRQGAGLAAAPWPRPVVDRRGQQPVVRPGGRGGAGGGRGREGREPDAELQHPVNGEEFGTAAAPARCAAREEARRCPTPRWAALAVCCCIFCTSRRNGWCRSSIHVRDSLLEANYRWQQPSPITAA